ncbi:MAG: hypothetical protein J6X14_05425 [Lachnospiraceae bacterium]|nr:hypothetical protein [Lachnospiraceae bacterium]
MSSTYSVTTYCGKILDAYKTKSKLTTMIVDLLNYGAAAQNYMDYKTDALVNAGLTTTQQSWATEDRAFNDVSEKLYVDEADLDDATFLGAALNLGETVSIRYVFTAESLSGLTLKVTDEKGNSWTFTESDFVPATESELPENSYSLYCRKLHAGRMSDKVYATLYRGGKKSMTVAYSIESYASKAGSGTSKLQLLLKAMMKYGDAARTIANTQ